MKKYIIILTVALGLSQGVSAQQDPHYSLHMFNGLFLNPAYAGSHEVLDVMAIYRAQWLGVDGAPMTGNGSIQSPLKRDQYALGLTVQGDQLGLTHTFGSTGSFAYRIKAGKTKISLGIQAGFTYYAQGNVGAQPDLNKININDPNFNVTKNLWVPNFGAGIYWYSKRFSLGFSVPHLLPTKLSEAVGVTDNKAVARQYNHYLLTGGVLIGKDVSVVKVRPTLLVKYVPGLSQNIPDFDLGLGFYFLDRFMLGANYRIGTASNNLVTPTYGSTSIAALAMVQLTQRLRIAYSYEHVLTDISKGVSFGTHDIMLGYEFNTGKKRFVSPRFVSFF
jgi:type IX secretion system PorP/SprF family membrane protein